jgi:hypothetical protein
MAFPLIPILLTAAGAGLSYAGQRRSAKATQNVWESFRKRNKAREAEAGAAVDTAIAKSGADTFDADAAAGAARRESAYESLASLPTPTTLPETGNKTVTEPQAKASVKNAGTAWSRLMNRAQSRLGARQDALLNNAVRGNRTQDELNKVSNFSRSDLNNVVPVQLEAAARKGDALQGWGSLLNTAGMLMGISSALKTAPTTGGTVAQRAATFQQNPALASAFTGQNSIWGSLLPN